MLAMVSGGPRCLSCATSLIRLQRAQLNPLRLAEWVLKMIQINSPASSREEEEVVVKTILLPSPGKMIYEGAARRVRWSDLVVDPHTGCLGMSVVLMGVFHHLWLHYI